MNQYQANAAKRQKVGHNAVGMATNGRDNVYGTQNATGNNLPPALYGNDQNRGNNMGMNNRQTPRNYSVSRSNMGSRSGMTTMPNQREWRQSRQSAKFKMAMDILDQFKANHGGKLPSLRAVMKMLKVGFPKAHEILDAYAAHIGVTVLFYF